MKRAAYIVIALLISQSAYSQISSGTLIVFQSVNNKFMIAADSRGSFNDSPHDTYCKIAAFRHQVIFAVGSGPFYVPGNPDPAPAWDATDEAHKAIAANASKRSDDSVSRVKSIADRWAENMKIDWQILNAFHPDLVNKFALDEHGNLTTGIFAAVSHGSVSFTVRSIVFNNGLIAIAIHDTGCTTGPCASGTTDIFTEFVRGKTERAKKEARRSAPLPKGMSRKMLHIIRLVELTIIYDTTHVVGGPIDAVELSGNGGIRWRQLKCNCPKNQD